MKINLEIPEEKVLAIEEAMSNLFPIPINQETKEKEFTNSEWVTACIKNFILFNEARYRQAKAQKEIPFTIDKSLVI